MAHLDLALLRNAFYKCTYGRDMNLSMSGFLPQEHALVLKFEWFEIEV